MPRRLVFPLPLLFSMSVVFEVPGGEVSPLVMPLRGLPVPPLLPLEGPPITVPRLMPNPMEFEFWFKPGGPTGPGPDWPTGNMAVISFSVQRENSPFGGVLENVRIGHHNELETLDKV